MNTAGKNSASNIGKPETAVEKEEREEVEELDKLRFALAEEVKALFGEKGNYSIKALHQGTIVFDDITKKDLAALFVYQASEMTRFFQYPKTRSQDIDDLQPQKARFKKLTNKVRAMRKHFQKMILENHELKELKSTIKKQKKKLKGKDKIIKHYQGSKPHIDNKNLKEKIVWKDKRIEELQTTNPELIFDESKFEQIFIKLGEKSAEDLAEAAYTITKSYREDRKRGKALTTKDEITILARVYRVIENILINARLESENDKYLIPHNTVKPVKIIEKIVPSNQLVNCTPEDIIKDSLPDHASLYDKILFDIKDYLLGKPVSKKEFTQAIKTSMNYAQFKINKQAVISFKIYRETGKLKNPETTQK